MRNTFLWYGIGTPEHQPYLTQCVFHEKVIFLFFPLNLVIGRNHLPFTLHGTKCNQPFSTSQQCHNGDVLRQSGFVAGGQIMVQYYRFSQAFTGSMDVTPILTFHTLVYQQFLLNFKLRCFYSMYTIILFLLIQQLECTLKR